MTFPRNVGQIPIYYNYKSTGRGNNKENNVFWSHYSDVENSPLYPFGYGLSYTSFEYKNLQIDKLEYLFYTSWRLAQNSLIFSHLPNNNRATKLIHLQT